jgi:amino acid adenylation domain-containing protein
VAETPGRIAVDFLVDLGSRKRIQYTYQNIDNAANALAVELVRICARSQPSSQLSVNTVAVLMGPCPELYTSYLAALKAGLAFCPIPVDAPRERQEALLADLRPAAIFVAASSRPDSTPLLSRSTPIPEINVAQYLATSGSKSETEQLSRLSTIAETDVAYILYTSGTTGMPKGVAVSHISAACTISSLSTHFRLLSPTSPSSKPIRWYQGASPTFDISLFEIFWTFSTGSTLCCAPRECTLQDIDKVLSVMEADMTNITPSFASLIDPSSIRGLMVGGETLNTRLLQDFARYNPIMSGSNGDCGHDKPSGIYNGYGPTETAIYSIAQARVPATQRGSVIGTPLATCGCLIVEPQTANRLEPVPMAAVGELVITGPQVSCAGYLNRPNETAAAFVDDAQWGRAYRTGDRARIVWGPGGEPMVEFLGRISDDQVKLSGRRVELGEIESVLASHVDGIRETMACVWKAETSDTGSERVVSLVVLEPGTRSEFELVHQRCLEVARQHLPDYMRPFKILQVDALPRSASGKLDRKAASAYVREALKGSAQPASVETVQNGNLGDIGRLSDPEEDKLEEELTDIVAGIVGGGTSSSPTAKITATTPLGQAGMDSLRAMRLLRDIRKRWPDSGSTGSQYQHARLQPSLALLLHSEASIRSVFFPSSQSVDALVKLDAKKAVIQRQLAEFSSKYVPDALDRLNLANAADIEMVVPTTCTQSQLAVSFAMDNRNYISHSVLKLRSDVSAERLKEAVEGVIFEQAIYRAAILPCEDPLSPFAQAIFTPGAWRRFVNDESRVVHRKASACQLAGDVKPWVDLAEENISLDSQKLYHIQIIEPDSDSGPEAVGTGLLVLSIAHCICDGASVEGLMSDITRRYAGLEPLQQQGIYDAVFEWASNVNPETDNLWRESLKGWETETFGSLSGDNVNPSIADTDRQHGMVEYASELPWQVLEVKSRALGASPLSILQASWSLLLNLFSESDTGDVVFGSIISGHHLSTQAPTFSVVPCRVALPEAQTISELVDSLATHSRFAQSHRHTSFGIFKARPYNTALALQAYAPAEITLQDGLSETVPALWTEIQNAVIRYDFPVFVEIFPTNPHCPNRNEHTDNMTFKLTYSGDALSQSSATCIIKQLAALVEVMLDSPPENLVQGLPSRLPMNLLSAEGAIPVPAENKQKADQKSPDRAELLHSQFEDQAASTPDLLALSFYTSLDSPPMELSYAELDSRANGLANILREENVEVIPICLQRSVELYVAVLAILKAGSAWCPIDETSPVQRRTSLIARTQSKVLLTTTESLHLVEPCLAHQSLEGVRVILLDKYADQKSSVRASPRDGISPSSQNLSGRDLAYLLWTSGTTGEPKGVMIQHSAAAQAMRDLQIRVEHDEKAGQVRTLQLSAYSFDVFVQDLFYTWGIAGSVISGTRELVLGTFVEFIWKSSPTHAHLTPSFGASIHVDELKGSTLQYVTFIGEKLTESVAEAWAAPEITTRAYNTYGPAENAVVSTMRRFYGKSRDRAKAANVGFPLGPCTAYVVREVEVTHTKQKRWELVPRYGIGELALGGAQVAKGYLSNEAKTAKSFIQGVPGINERIYLTGDVARLNDHGFEFLGRNDDLVKITGIRIELSEISAACASLKDENAAVEHVETLHLPRPGAATDSNNKVIVTFVSVKKSIADAGKIRAQVFQRARDLLPTYMVPGHVVVLETTMPRTASNKVDRKALQGIYQTSDLNILAGREGGSSEQSTCDGNQTKLKWTKEQLSVLHIIADEFKVAAEPLSPEDSLAGLGFSSLQVTKLAWSLKRRLKCSVGVLALMRCQSLGELVDVVVSKLPGQKTAPPPANGTVSSEPEPAAETTWLASIRDALTKKIRGEMRPHDTLYVVPTTPIQESLIAETMLEPRAYWAHRVFDLSHLGNIDGQRLKDSWTEAARRFDMLRTTFLPLTQLDVDRTEEHGSNVVAWARQQGIRSTILQLVRSEPTVCWAWLTSNDEDHDLARLAEKLQMELAPTTTIRSPWAVTFDEPHSRVMLSMHHALYDSVSSEILLDTVAKLYQGQIKDAHDNNGVVSLAKGMELGLLPTASQRDEAASLLDSRLASAREAAGALNAPFPDLTQSRQKQPRRILLSRKPIPPFLLTPRSAAAPKSPNIPTLFQSAFGCVLASYLELKAVVLGQTVSQRILHPDLARVMGPAMATLPVLVRADALSAEELWGKIARDSSNLSQTMRNLHPVDIKRTLNQGSESSNAPFPGFFVYHPASGGVDDQDNTAQQMFRGEEQALSLNVEHPLALNIFELDGTMELTGDGSRISQAQLDLMLDQIIEQAKAMLESPQLSLHLLLNKMDRSLVSISGTAGTHEEARAVDPTEQVSRHASEHSEWIAVEELTVQPSDGNDSNEIITKTITYAQLDRLTNVIASSLASHQAHLQPDDVVAMYLSRDIKSLATTLAIFRAGYVYLPVDEDLPSARKQLLIRDARAKLIITTQELARDLDLDLDTDPPVLFIPDGDDAINLIMSWPLSHHQRQAETGQGGYLLYTSGSTGRPKGVRVSNSNLCHFITAFSARLIEASPATAALGGTGKYLNLTSRAFDPHLTQMFVPWHLGYRVVIGRDRTAVLGSLQQVINELGITHFGSVPSVLTQLGLRPEDMPSVMAVTTGGEKASSGLLDMWTKGGDRVVSQEGQQQDHSGAVLFNFYGPTEVTIGCLGHPVNAHSNARNLGLPLQGLEALLLCPDTGDEQVVARRGQPGELCIAGPQVSMGYLDRPAENAKSFQTTTLLGDGLKRMYRTGDIMRMMHDGTLEFLGRADQQAKIRGQRLELDEVVHFLKEAAAGDGVADLDFAAAVVSSGGGESNQQQQQLFGFMARKARNPPKITTNTEVELLQDQDQAWMALLGRIEQKCETGLPAFMVPTMLSVSRIPYLAASGKVDTKLLAKLANDFFASQKSQQGPVDSASTTSLEHVLNAGELAIVTAVEEAVGTKIHSATATSSIHRLGIDSLSAVHLMSLLRRRGFSKIKMVDILSSSCTVRSLARLADRHLNGSAPANGTSTSNSPDQQVPDMVRREVGAFSATDLGPLPADLSDSEIEAVLPCLPLQSALVARSLSWWLRTKSTGDGDEDGAPVDVPYVAQFHYRLSRGTDVGRWKKAAEAVVASEAMLRTCFVQREHDGQIFQIVLQHPPVSPFDCEEDAAGIVAKMSTRPPVRLHIQDTGAHGETVISLWIHHALFDGVAIDVLRKRLELAYDGRDLVDVSGNKKSLGVLTDITGCCYLSGAQLESTRHSWQTRLHGVRQCRVGTENDKNKGTMVRSTRCLDYTTSDLKAKLRAPSQHPGVPISVSTAFQLATALCLAQLTGQTSVVYGFVMSLRALLAPAVDGADEFIGPCLNTLVQTLRFRGADEALPDVAQRAHEAHTAACQGTLPFASVEQVQRWAGSEDRLFDSLLSINLIPVDDEAENGSGEPAPGRMSALRTHSKSDMALAIDVDLHTDGKIVLTLSSAGALTKSQLDDVGRLFGEVVYSSADENVRVDRFLPAHQWGATEDAAITNGYHASNHVAPESGLADEGYQQALAGVRAAISRLLRLKPSDIPDDAKATSLYQLGLDSITVIPFVKLINKLENIWLAPDAVIKARTIQGTARLVQEMKTKRLTKTNGNTREDSTSTRNDKTANDMSDEDIYDATLQRLAKDLLFAATPLQESMLSASLAIADKAYTYVHTIQLSESALAADTPTLDKFFAAVRDTVQACEILRTRFIFTQDDEAPWVGVVSPSEQSDLVSWEVVNSGPPGRVQLRIHHALYDATSIRAVWRILGENYARRLQDHDNNIGSRETMRYHPFRSFARTVALAQRVSVAFWANLLQDYNYTPLDLPNNSLQASSSFYFTFNEQDLLLLQARCRSLNVTTKAALQLSWVKVLCESLYGQADVVYGEVVSTDGGSGANGDVAVVGPTINTVPMRVKLADDRGVAISAKEALARVQELSDDARGTVAMGSLRKIQALWRSSNQDQEHLPAVLFQSLFVFDGVVTSAITDDGDAPAQSLFKTGTQSQTQSGEEESNEGGPAYDDTPVIVSFHIKNNALHGKLRAKMTKDEVETLGSRLEAALRWVLSSEVSDPVLDNSQMDTVEKGDVAVKRKAADNTMTSGHSEKNGSNPMADAVLDLTKTVLGTRWGGKEIGYKTKLVNVGLDSILAIRLSMLLKKQMGITASVFDISKGASIHDIVKKATLTQEVVEQKPREQLFAQDEELKESVANKLGLPKDQIKSVLPVLPGQRTHLEQWLHSGKRFFEPPWVYRVVDGSLDAQKVASCWAELCRVHGVLRTTFVWADKATGVVQVTLGEQWTGKQRVTVLQDLSKPIQAVIDEHVEDENRRPSDLKVPPASLSFLEAQGGQAVVLRVHHALYDAWSIRMIVIDLNELLAFGKVLESRAPFEQVVQKIRGFRQPDAEGWYWKQHLSHAQDTVLYGTAETGSDESTPKHDESPLGSHFKASYPTVVPQSTINRLWQTWGSPRISAAIVLAYARTLEHFTKRSRPTFGLNHASRSLSSVDGAQTLDLTAVSVPTLTVTPFCINLGSSNQDARSSSVEEQEHLLDHVQDHLAQLSKFAQSDGWQKYRPRFNSYLNIVNSEDNTATVEDEGDKTAHAAKVVLRRHKLGEPFASDYFTVTKPSSSTASTIEALETGHLCPHQLFFNVIVRRGQDVSVAVSGDEGLCGGGLAMSTTLVSFFGCELNKIVKGTCTN